MLRKAWLPLVVGQSLLIAGLHPYFFQCFDCEEPGKTEMAGYDSRRIAYEVYPRWRIAHPYAPCSRFATEGLADQPTHVRDDPWGNPYIVRCLSATEFQVVSRGPDGLPGNDDDLQELSVNSVGPRVR